MRTTARTPVAVRRQLASWMLVYVTAGLVAALLEPQGGQAAWYPPVAVGVFVLMRFGLHRWPLVVAADVLVSIAQYDGHVGAAVASGMVTALEIAGICLLLRRLRFDQRMSRVEDVGLLVGVGGVMALAAATVGTLVQRWTGVAEGEWRVWVIGDLSGLTLVLPALLLGAQLPSPVRELVAMTHRRSAEYAVASTLSILLAGAFFAYNNPSDFDPDSVGVLLCALLPVFWIALRFGPYRTTVFVLAVDVAASFAFTGLGPHVFGSATARQESHDMVTVQLPMFAIGLAALGVAVATAAQQRAIDREAAIFDASPFAIVALDRQGAVTSWSRAAETIFGWSADEAIGRIPPMIPPEDRPEFRRRFVAELRGTVEQNLDYRRKDGSTVPVRLVTAPLADAAGAPVGVMGIIEDVTEIDRLRERQVLLNAAMDQAADAIVVTDLTPAILYANPAASASSGYSLEEVLGQNPRIFKSHLHDVSYYREMWNTITAGDTWTGVMVNRRKNGDLFYEQTSIRPVTDRHGDAIAYVAVKHDLTRQRQLEADLQQGRDTRVRVMNVMEHVRAGQSVGESADSLAQAVVDYTDFDIAVVLLRNPDGGLVAIGEAGPLMATKRGRVISRHQGADELVALTGRAPWWMQADAPAGRMGYWRDRFTNEQLDSLAFAPMKWDDDVFALLMVASRDPGSSTWCEQQLPLLTEVASFGGVLLGSQHGREQSTSWSTDIADTIEHARFHPVFQPIIDLADDSLVGYEALSRFDDGMRPDRKIDEAWIAGLGPQLEVALAAAALRTADDLFPGTTMSLNFSPETILNGMAAEVTANAGREILIEVTEHTPIEDYPALREALRKCGRVKVSVDDAGAGFASLRHILELEPDVVKLDIGLIRGIDHDLARQALAAGLCHYARQTGTQLIAEGIETEGEARTVRSLGVHWAQGYFFGPPSRTG